jgi:uncharacterized protein
MRAEYCSRAAGSRKAARNRRLIASTGNLAKLPLVAQWPLLAAASAAFAALLHLAGLPAGLLLGPMAAGVLFGVNAATVRAPLFPYIYAQALMGLFIASAITPSILRSFAREWPIILAVVLSVVAVSSFFGFVMGRWRVMPGTTGVWGTWPGAASAMVIMAGEFGADARLVAFMQYVRVVCVVGVASIVAALWAHGSGVPHPVADWFPDVHARAFSETLLLGGACALAGRFLRIPSGPMLLALFSGAILHLSGAIVIELPKWLMAGVYALIGWSAGLRFTPAILGHALRAIPKILVFVAALISFCAALAYLLTQALGIDALTAYLATSPGGLDSIAIVAASTNVDAPFVIALQTIRFLAILVMGPPLARFIARRLEATRE